MTEELNRAKEIDDAVKAADAKKRADAEESASAGEKIDRLLDCMDSLSKRMDSFEMDSKKRKDADAEAEEIKEKGDPRESSVDSARADSAENLRELAEIQSFADRADSAWSKSAPAPWQGEMPDAYRRRLAAGHVVDARWWRL